MSPLSRVLTLCCGPRLGGGGGGGVTHLLPGTVRGASWVYTNTAFYRQHPICIRRIEREARYLHVCTVHDVTGNR